MLAVVVLVSGCESTVDTWGGFDRRPISVENPPCWAEKLNKTIESYCEKKCLQVFQTIKLYIDRKWLEA